MSQDSTILSNLARLLPTRGLSRRDFLAQAMAFGLTATTASSMWSRVAEAAPNRGGHFKVGMTNGSSSDSLDPSTFYDFYMFQIGYTIRNNLTEIGPDNKIRGELAENWKPSDGASVWHFDLRKGVEFSNGKSLEPEDVIASINMHRGENSKSGAKSLVSQIANIKADGKNSVVFELVSGNADFPVLLSDYHLNIMPIKNGEPDWRSGIGTANYMLEHFEPGIRTIVKRNPNAWKEDAGYFESAEIVNIDDDVARMSALRTGAVDAMNKVPSQTADLLAKTAGVRVEEHPSTFHYVFAMDTTTSPFDNNDVRLAFKYAIDREEMLRLVLRGHGTVGNDQPISTLYQSFADLPQHQYDPDKAKFHLKKAGHDSLTVTLVTAEGLYPGSVNAAELYSNSAAKAGIKMQINRVPVDGYWSEVWLKQPFMASYNNGRLTADWEFSVTYQAGAPWNETHWDNRRFNELLVAARAELDEAKRREMYREMQVLVRDEGGAVIPMFVNDVDAMVEKVRHADRVSSVWPLDGLKCVERWWFS